MRGHATSGRVVAQRREPMLESRALDPTMLADDLADLLETLVNIPSRTGNEAAIAQWVGERLEARDHGEVLRSGHAVVWRGPRRDRPLLVLAGHLDTVPGEGVPARRESGRLVGLGSSDMKAGDAVLLALIEHLDP